MAKKERRETPLELSPDWPNEPSPDHAGETARLITLGLLEAMNGRSIRSVAKAAELNEGTLRRLISGQSWPDVRTIARLERALDVKIYRRIGD
jgi:hypothetical protein